jgi:tetratricopeptide (TPR) repeat protein
MRARLVIAGTVAALAAAVPLFGGILRGGSTAVAAAPRTEAVAEQLQRGFAAGDTASLVARLQAQVKADRHNVKAHATLGLAYLQRARETGDPTYYPKADGILHRAVALDRRDLLATIGLGELALARHQFRLALSFGRRAERLSPSTSAIYGVIGDAAVELGRYRQAFASFDRLASLKPGVAGYARVSYARELRGDLPGAERAMQLAADAATGAPEAEAWTRVHLALLDLSRGRPQQALKQARAALVFSPAYHLGLDALAQAHAALGNLPAAVAAERVAAERVPLPQYVGFLGDLERVAGHPVAAKRQYALIGVIQKLLVANGVESDLDIAQFNLDHGIRLREALRLARRGHAERPSVFGDDVLAWALERNGRCAEALPYSVRALRLGSLDAVKFFHRGMIERCLGRSATARVWFRRALATNPHFSLIWAPVIRRYAR